MHQLTQQVTIFRHLPGSPSGFFVNDTDHANAARIELAFESAKTWDQFRDYLPKGEFESVFEYCLYLPGASSDTTELTERIQEDWGDSIVFGADPFDPEAVGGFSDGDYPPFLAPDANHDVPEDFREKYGKYVDSFISGFWYQYPASRFEEMKKALERLGFAVREDSSR